ncbi:MAG: hypothetical protein LQ341_004784 [Variospora aurantia]|nr:MAG: hypothetical protein LQ341_004784 [Variospora aurantia]
MNTSMNTKPSLHSCVGPRSGAGFHRRRSQKLVGNAYLKAAPNVGTAHENCELPTNVLIEANQRAEAELGLWVSKAKELRNRSISNSTVDGGLILDLPSSLFTVMAGHNSDETALLASLQSNTQPTSFTLSSQPPSFSGRVHQLKLLFPSTTKTAMDLYRRLPLDADVCNNRWTVLLASIFAPRPHNYTVPAPPGFRPQDLAYTFYSG